MMNNRRPMMPQQGGAGLQALGMGQRQQSPMGRAPMMNNGGQPSLGMQRPQQRPPMQQQRPMMPQQAQPRMPNLQNLGQRQANPMQGQMPQQAMGSVDQQVKQLIQAIQMERDPMRKQQLQMQLRQMLGQQM